MYTDYYYAVYAVLLVMLWSAATLLSIRIRRGAPRAGVVTTTLGVLLALDLLLIAIIAVTGGTRFDLDPLAVSVRGIRNPLTVFWLLLAAWLWRRYPVGVSFGWQGGRPPARRWTPSMTVAAVLALLAALWLALFQVIAAGDCATQSVMWRSSPPGADLLTAALGHPRHILTGDLTAAVRHRCTGGVAQGSARGAVC